MVTRNKYFIKFYTDHSALKNIFTKKLDANKKIVYCIDRLIEYNYEIYHWHCKKNIMQITDKISHLLIKYSQHITAIDLKKIILMVTFFQF